MNNASPIRIGIDGGNVPSGDLGRISPRVSVIMATHNGSRFVRQSISSILAQTWRDFELIVVDDCSTDETPDILASIDDTRLRVIRNPCNLGVAASRNRCFSEVRGEYVAMLDHDDLSRPTRLAKQVEYLDAQPMTVMVATAAHNLEDGRFSATKHPATTTPALISWLLYVANPLICSSVMFRAAAARNLDSLMRKNFDYADDYDLYHRMRGLGQIARLDERLTIYRLHSANAFRKHEDIMIANAVKVLAPAYAAWFGCEAEAAARLVLHHLSAGKPVPDAATMSELARHFEHLNRSFMADHVVNEADRAAIRAHADELWHRMLRVTARHGKVSLAAWMHVSPSGNRPSIGDIAHFALGRVPWQGKLRGIARGVLRRSADSRALPPSNRLLETDFEPVATDLTQPPTLYVVVDTEAEFDWSKPFSRELTGVTAMDDIERGQAVFDKYGLRPIYAMDYPVASQERSASRLRRILERGGCEIGAHLHPWTTPPFTEELSNRNSYPGNLPPWLEEQKLAELIGMIRARFDVDPVFYKAGRYGFGPATEETLARHGIKVDLSVLPGADLRREDGPDFHSLQAQPYQIGHHGIVTVPMTRSHVGLMPSLGGLTGTILQNPRLRTLRLQSVLSRLRIVDTITLTPEGVTADEQIRMIKAMLRRGQRLFMMHYHSPSLSPGRTPYVRTEADARDFIARLHAVCHFFFETIGGMPGFPRDLVPHEANIRPAIVGIPALMGTA